MIPTPQEVVPPVVPVVGDLRDALRTGIDYADDLQPDAQNRDNWFWSNCARFRARNALRTVVPDGWALVDRVANSGIHLTFAGLHVARVLRSFAGSTPPPGRNQARRSAYQQGQFPLDANGTLPPLSLILDWRESQGEPEIHIGFPHASWDFKSTPKLHWRIELPEGGVDLNSLAFDQDAYSGEELIELPIDPSETDTGTESDDR
jgi:hypothetical protein